MKENASIGVILSMVIIGVYSALAFAVGFSAVTTILGALIICFIPGYMILNAMWENGNKFNSVEKFVFSFCISIAITGIAGYLLDRFWIVNFRMLFVLIAIISTISFVLALLKTPKFSSKPVVDWIYARRSEFRSFTGNQKILVVAVVFSLAVTIPSAAYFVEHRPREAYTAFGLVDIEGLPCIVKNATINEPFDLSCMIRNNEYRVVNYNLSVYIVSYAGDKDCIYAANHSILDGQQQYCSVSVEIDKEGVYDVIFTLTGNGVEVHQLTLKGVEVYE
jgi:uncharacterized membrane protein